MVNPLYRLRSFTLITLVLIISACAVPTPKKSPKSPQPIIEKPVTKKLVTETISSLDQAKSAYEAEDYTSASSITQTLPLSDDDSALLKFIIHSAKLRLEANDRPALAYLMQMNADPLPARWRLQYQLDMGRMLGKTAPFQALLLLMQPAATPEDLPDHPALFADLYRQRGVLLLSMGYPEKSVAAFHQVDPFLKNDLERTDNQRLIWQGLSSLTPEQVTRLKESNQDNREMIGWLELLEINRQNARIPLSLASAITSWRVRFPNHPLLPGFTLELHQRNLELMIEPKNVAVLLPFSGRYANVSAAIREGISAAWFQDIAKGEVTLRFYDTQSNPEKISALLNKVNSDGADFILGPLNKEVIEAMTQLPELTSIPILALNHIDNVGPATLFQFSLSPEDEANDAATHIWKQGYSRVGLLLPESSLGERLASAFQNRWQHLGGETVNLSFYDPTQSDYSHSITLLMDLQQSEGRKRDLQRLLGESLEFTPRRRQDIEAIFLSATPRSARLLNPQLRFHHAGDLPLFSTSHIYSGEESPEKDRDLNGMTFEDIPFNLQPLPPEAIEARLLKQSLPANYRRLAAMGIDAYSLMPYLHLMQRYPYETIQGHTGQLSLNESRQIVRQLTWAKMIKGKPRVIKPSEPSEKLSW